MLAQGHVQNLQDTGPGGLELPTPVLEEHKELARKTKVQNIGKENEQIQKLQRLYWSPAPNDTIIEYQVKSRHECVRRSFAEVNSQESRSLFKTLRRRPLLVTAAGLRHYGVFML